MPDFGGRRGARRRGPGRERPTCSTTTWRRCPGSIRTVRPQAVYERSLAVLRQAAEERRRRHRQDRPHGRAGGDAGRSAAVLGGRPRRRGRRGDHRPVSAALVLPSSGGRVRASRRVRGVRERAARELGLQVHSAPFVRSSFHAGESFDRGQTPGGAIASAIVTAAARSAAAATAAGAAQFSVSCIRTPRYNVGGTTGGAGRNQIWAGRRTHGW